MIPQESLQKAVVYDPSTGVFTYRPRQRDEFRSTRAWAAWNGRFALAEAGTPTGHGYTKLTIYRHKIYAHRAAWVYVYGDSPNFIDHINGQRWDNRIANLRSVTRAENQMNRPVQANNRLGVKGVHRAGNSYIAGITVAGECVHIGSFKTVKEAADAYDAAAIECFGPYARLNGYAPEERAA